MISNLILMLGGSFVQIWLNVMILSWAFDFKYSPKIVVGVWVAYLMVLHLLRSVGANRSNKED